MGCMMTRERTRNEMCALSSVMEDSIWCDVNDKNSRPKGSGLVVVGNGACRLPGPMPTGRCPTRLTAKARQWANGRISKRVDSVRRGEQKQYASE